MPLAAWQKKDRYHSTIDGVDGKIAHIQLSILYIRYNIVVDIYCNDVLYMTSVGRTSSYGFAVGGFSSLKGFLCSVYLSNSNPKKKLVFRLAGALP
jgi:hypothetical protein